MNQHQLDRVVARRTGESVRYIHRRGFQLIVMPKFSDDHQRQLSIDTSTASSGSNGLASARVAS